MYTDFADLDEGKYSEGGGVKKLKRKKFLLYTNPNNITNKAYVALGDSIKSVMQSSREYPGSYTILYTAMGTNEDLQKAKAMFSNYSFTNDITIMKDGGEVTEVDTFNKMLDELDDLTNSYLESDYSSKAAMLSAHKEIEKKYPNQYSDFEKWLDKGSEGFFGYKKGGGVGNIAKKGMRVFDPHDVVSDKGKWKEDLEMYLTDYRGDAYGDPENWREMKPNIKFHDYDSKKTSFLKRNPSNVIAEYAGEIVGKWDADLEEGYIYYDKMKDGGNVVFSPVAVEKANIEELFEMAEEIGLKNYHNLNKEFLRKKILQKFNVEFKTGGVNKQKVYVDLFEDYENIPKKVQEIVDEYGENFGGDGSEMDYQDTANMLKDVEAVGYTFSYGLDNEPFGLRPIGVRLNQLRDYEDLDDDDYAEGGKVDYFAKTKSSVDFLFNKGDNIKVLQIQSNGKLGKEKAIILEKYPAKQNDGTFYPFYYVQLEGLNNKSLYAQDELIERHGNKPKMKKGGGIDINDLNMPVIRTQFEEEDFEFEDGGKVQEVVKGKYYNIYDPGMDTWNDWEYISYIPGYHIFREEAPMGSGTEIKFTNEELKSYLKENLIKKSYKHGGSTIKGGKFNINGNYLDNISNDKKNEILKNIANHYGISLKDAEEEVKDADAEMLYDYIANDKSLKMEIYNHFEKSGIGKIAFPIKDKMANGGLTKGFEYTIGGL